MVSRSGLTPYEYRINGMTLICKVADGFIAFVSGKRFNKNEAMQPHRFPQISYGARVAPQRCPILRMSKMNSIMSKIHHIYSFVSMDAFSFVY